MKSGKTQMVILMVVLSAFLMVPSYHAWADDYPTRPINFVIHYSAGGSTDLACRALTEAAGKVLGQPFVPINKGGAGGTIASMHVMSAKPDGYTIGSTSTSNIIVAPFGDDTPYKDLKGFTQIANFGNYFWAVTVRDDAPWKTWKEFIEWAKKNPGAAKIATTGARSNTILGLCTWLIERKENVRFTYLPFKGSSEVYPALLGGHANLATSSIDAALIPYLKLKKARILLYLCDVKLPGTENIPTLKELYGFEVPNIMGIFAPKGISESVVQKLDNAFALSVKDPGFVKVMDQMYSPIVYMNHTEITNYVDRTIQKTGELIKWLKEEEAMDAKGTAVKK